MRRGRGRNYLQEVVSLEDYVPVLGARRAGISAAYVGHSLPLVDHEGLVPEAKPREVGQPLEVDRN